MTGTDVEDGYLRATLRLLELARQYEEPTQSRSDAWLVQPGSALAGDDARTDPYHVSHSAWQALTVAVDHLHCLRRSLVEKVGKREIALTLHTHGQASLLRGAFENSARTVWILSPSSRLERVERRLALQAADHKASDRTMQLLGQTPARSFDARMQQLALLAQGAGLNLSEGEIRKRLIRGALPTHMVRAAGASTPLGSDQAQVVWSACSSLAHGDLHGSLSMLEREEVSDDGKTKLLRLSTNAKVTYWVTDRSVTMLHEAFRYFDLRRRSHLGP
ncbi:hypothetical protein ACFYXH_08165 [Streptomyces sp. NPDC002730]|uniref:hypothetical protein n=1 Tax=Streptomyces sp. NPDC002730 TaxID=3364662 RepID=UPI0036A7C916